MPRQALSYTLAGLASPVSSAEMEREQVRWWLHCTLLLMLLPWLVGSHPVGRGYTERQNFDGGLDMRAEGHNSNPGADPTTASKLDRRSLTDTSSVHLWPNGIIPYIFDFTHLDGFTEEQKRSYEKNIKKAIGWWENTTCVRFVPHEEHHSGSIIFTLRNETVGCKAYPGYGVRYPVTLDMTCLNSIGGIAHELGHVIGFLHEHNRRDRDQYIEILLDNIREERRRYYNTKSNNYTYVSTHYDLGSIMQYPPYNGDAIDMTLPTFRLRPNVNYPGTIGQRECLSYLDIQSTNLLYKCRLPVTVTACNNVQVSFTDRTVGSASNTGPTAETTSAESGSGENRSNQNATNKNESESLRPTEEVEDQEEDEETLVEATLDPVTSTPDSNRRPKVVYAGDVLGFKSNSSDSHRWIGCQENEMQCYAWGCPGNRFKLLSSSGQKACYPFYMFTIDLAERRRNKSNAIIRVGDSVVLKMRDPNLGNDTYVPMQCTGSEGHCRVNREDACQSNDWQNTNSLHCRPQIFRIAVPGKEDGVALRHNNVVVLQDASSSNSLLTCSVGGKKYDKTCQLETCTSPNCSDDTHHFIVFKF